MRVDHRFGRIWRRLVLGFGALAVGACAGRAEPVQTLDPLEIEADPAEVEVFPEERPDLFPFRVDESLGPLLLPFPEDPGAAAVAREVEALVDFRPGDFASVSGAGTPRGFTALRLRNGLTQRGIQETLVGGRTELLTGFLGTLFGRTAPGGIYNLISRRPSPKATGSVNLAATGAPSVAFGSERAGAIDRRGQTHGRATLAADQVEGPEDFARRRGATATVAVRRQAGPGTVLLFEAEAAWTRSRPGGGLLQSRAGPGESIEGPFLPLAGFNPQGPEAWAERESASASLWLEHRWRPGVLVRAGGQVWGRRLEELRFTFGPFVRSTGRLDGVRQPQWSQREDVAAAGQVEVDARWDGERIDQRVVAGIEVSQARAEQRRRGLADGGAGVVPEAGRSLDPAAPDYTLPGFREELYRVVLTDQREATGNAGAFVSHRASFGRGRYNTTVGLRHDRVEAEVRDERAGARTPRALADNGRTTGYAGLVYIVWPTRLAGFLNYSSAFQPQRRVDNRTGRIQGNETTEGVESGLRYTSPAKDVTLAVSLFRLFNRNITRRNPLLDDPVLDPDRNQPELVSSGQERFTGADFSCSWRPVPPVNLNARLGWLEAVTTASPDLPQEVGRQLARSPSVTGSLSANWTLGRGWSAGANWAWIGPHVAVYPSASRLEVRYDGYDTFGLNLSYGWTARRWRHSAGLGLSNALDRDLLAAAGRLGGERQWSLRYGVAF